MKKTTKCVLNKSAFRNLCYVLRPVQIIFTDLKPPRTAKIWNLTKSGHGDVYAWSEANTIEAKPDELILYVTSGIPEVSIQAPKDASSLFVDFSSANYHHNFYYIDVSNLDVSHTRYFSRMFYEVGYEEPISVTLEGLSFFDMENAQSAWQMFYNCGKICRFFYIDEDIKEWNMEKVRAAGDIFTHMGENATNWSLNLSNWKFNKEMTDEAFNTTLFHIKPPRTIALPQND